MINDENNGKVMNTGILSSKKREKISENNNSEEENKTFKYDSHGKYVEHAGEYSSTDRKNNLEEYSGDDFQEYSEEYSEECISEDSSLFTTEGHILIIDEEIRNVNRKDRNTSNEKIVKYHTCLAV